MKKLFFSFFLLFAFTANSQLYIKNNYDKPYKVSVALFVSQHQFSGWISQGWYELAPGEEKEIFPSLPKDRYVYYYAIGEQDTIKGYKKMLVNPNLDEQYSVIHAILNSTKDKTPALEWFRFKEVRRAGVFIKRKKEFRFVLGE
jgi:hypothetical protein